jgi:hypothetical protein
MRVEVVKEVKVLMLVLRAEDGESVFLRNVDSYLPTSPHGVTT